MHRRRDVPSLACQQLVELVNDFLDDQLDADKRTAVENHLAACADCTSYVRQVRRMLELSAAMPSTDAAPVPAALLETLMPYYRRRRP